MNAHLSVDSYAALKNAEECKNGISFNPRKPLLQGKRQGEAVYRNGPKLLSAV